MISVPENYKEILKVMRDAFVCVDMMTGRLLLCNDAYCAMLGYEREELYSKTYLQLTPEKWHVLDSEIVQKQILTRGFSDLYEKEYQRKDGSVFPVELITTLRRDENGDPAEMMAVVRDISERKMAELERGTTIEFLRIVNESTGVHGLISAAMLFFRKQYNCSAVGIRLREEDDFPYFVAHGFPPDFVRAENSLCSKDVNGEVIRDSTGNPMLDCMCGNVICGRFDAEQPFFTAQGSFWTNSTTEFFASSSEGNRQGGTRNRCNSEGFESLALIPLVIGQERLGLLQFNDMRRGAFSLDNVSQWERMAGYLAIALEKIRSEESLKSLNAELDRHVQERTHRLELALKEQEAFSYSVSHDLRAPLRHINSYLAILSEDFGNYLPHDAHDYLQNARRASLHAGEMIDGLLELSRISRSNLVKTMVNLSDLATHVCEKLHEGLPERQAEFLISKGLCASGDQTLLLQVFENLIGNAWKYTTANLTTRIEFGKVGPAGHEAFYIKDNGVGFDAVYKDKLFRAFERLHGSEFEGNGIGLATVKRIIDRHGGTVWADSIINEGATFYFKL